MTRTITAISLYQELKSRLHLEWVAGDRDLPADSFSQDDLADRPSTAGFLNLIHPNKIQVRISGCIFLASALAGHFRLRRVERLRDLMVHRGPDDAERSPGLHVQIHTT